MNKSALKTFATSARKELLKKVEAKAMKIGITEDTIKKVDIESSDAIFIDGKQLSKEEKIQRGKLITRINQIGFKQVMEEVAYTWFNRFTALRYMEVNEYLPTDVRVLSSTNADSAEPDMIGEALSLELEIDKEYVYDLKLNNKTEELFKYLIIKHCNDLNRYLPFMFETIDDYTEILFPEGLLAKDSFIRQMTDTEFIPEDNWQKVEVIGWLYQYYIAEEKDRVIHAKKKYKTEEIPFATQLFTSDWIVRYMVQNSLGRYWVESNPEHRDLIDNWEFYLENPNPNFVKKLSPFVNSEFKVEDIKCFDPAMGSGHILVYMFDVLYEIYSKCGYMEREIPRLIIENNLFGLDIDDRAYQLACFSVVMKAMEYNKRFFRYIERDGLMLNLASIQETNELIDEDIVYIAGESSGEKFSRIKSFLEQFKDAKVYGSLIKIEEFDIGLLEGRNKYIQNNPAENIFEEESRKKVINLLPNLIKQSHIMKDNSYDLLITNPPYIGSNYMNTELSTFIEKDYRDFKHDIFSAFINYSINKVKTNGQLGFLTPYVWMFIKSHEKLRTFILDNCTISSLVQLEYNAFESATVPVCTFTLRKNLSGLSGEYIKLSDFKGSENQPVKTKEAIENPNVSYRFTSYSKLFEDIEGKRISYWTPKKVTHGFKNTKISEIATTRKGMVTADNDRFIRFWFEVSNENIGYNCNNREEAKSTKKKWFPYSKGGGFKKWSGNFIHVVNWLNDGYELLNMKNEGYKVGSTNHNLDFIFKPVVAWNKVTSSKFSARFVDKGFLFDDNNAFLITDNDENNLYILGYLNSNVASVYLGAINPTISFQPGDIGSVPILIEKTVKESVLNLVNINISLSNQDWNYNELSWEYRRNALLDFKESSLIEDSFETWKKEANKNFLKVKESEEELNRIFIDVFDVKGEISPEINNVDITISKAERIDEIKSFISYSVACIFGRYSLDEEGLIYAGGKFNPDKYRTFTPDKDNILPILPGNYFEDDIVSRFIEFVQVTFGEETLAVNLGFIADTLGMKKGETAKETIRRYFLYDFFKDHVQKYKKRPIYWLFSSGKQKAFNCLIYMHRYDKTTLSRIRTDYLHEYQIRLDAEKKDLLNMIEGDYSTKEISSAKKELKTLDKKIEELKEYDEVLHHMADMQIEMDLDDGVVVNYEMFKGLVAKI